MPESEPADLQEVFLGASAPAALPPGDEFTARFVAYLEDEKDAVEAMLHQLSPRSTSVLGLKRCRWQPGTCVTVSLSGRWLEVEDAQQTFTWDSAYAMLDFDVRLGTDAPQGVTILKFDVAIDGIRVAKLRMDLEVVDHRTASPPKTAVTEAARTAFASYASNDRQRVLDRLASIRISAGLDVFMDCLSLRPGDRWKLELAREIRSRDQFLLFWSHSAATSQWVAWEWQTALSEKGWRRCKSIPWKTTSRRLSSCRNCILGMCLWPFGMRKRKGHRPTQATPFESALFVSSVDDERKCQMSNDKCQLVVFYRSTIDLILQLTFGFWHLALIEPKSLAFGYTNNRPKSKCGSFRCPHPN